MYHIPRHGFSSGPRQESGPIWAFVVVPHQTHWLFNCWDLGSLDRSPYVVVQMTVTCCLGALLRQDNPCSPRASTGFPHAHVCGSQALQPNLWATATLIASSDSLSPTAVIGGACNQSVEMPQQEVWLYPHHLVLWKELGFCDVLQLVQAFCICSVCCVGF